ncbi:MAG: aldo/keto reductase [Propionibacterium sp.]|nr:aldo/keto reductase [Propionibacterium sp.]
MQQRTLGSQGLTVSAIGYGAMGITSFYGESDTDQGIAAIRRAYDEGITLFDTAELYGWGEGERVLGRAIRGFRDEVVIASKFGFTPRMGCDSSPDNIRRVIDNSLRHLGVDHIDLMYQHRVDPNVPIEDVAGTVKEAIEAGKVKYFGLCEAGPNTLRRAHAVQPVSALQTEYSMFVRDVEALFPTLAELGIGLVAYSPLARGFLSGAVQQPGEYGAGDLRGAEAFPWWAPDNFPRNENIASLLAGVAGARGATLPQLALAWLLTRRDDVVPIPGTRNPDRVSENVYALNLRLDEEDLALIEDVIRDGPYGERNTEGVVWD